MKIFIVLYIFCLCVLSAEDDVSNLSLLRFGNADTSMISEFSLVTYNAQFEVASYIACKNNEFVIVLASADGKKIYGVIGDSFSIRENTEDVPLNFSFISTGHARYLLEPDEQAASFQALDYGQTIKPSMSADIFTLFKNSKLEKIDRSDHVPDNLAIESYIFELFRLEFLRKKSPESILAPDRIAMLSIARRFSDKALNIFEIKTGKNADLRILNVDFRKIATESLAPSRSASGETALPETILNAVRENLQIRNYALKARLLNAGRNMLTSKSNETSNPIDTVNRLRKLFYLNLNPYQTNLQFGFLTVPVYDHNSFILKLNNLTGEETIDLLTDIFLTVINDKSAHSETIYALGDILCLLNSAASRIKLSSLPDLKTASRNDILQGIIWARAKQTATAVEFLQKIVLLEEIDLPLRLLSIEGLFATHNDLPVREAILKTLTEYIDNWAVLSSRFIFDGRFIELSGLSSMGQDYIASILRRKDAEDAKLYAINAIRVALNHEKLNHEVRLYYMQTLNEIARDQSQQQEVRFQSAITFLRLTDNQDDFTELSSFLVSTRVERLISAAVSSLKISKKTSSLLFDLWNWHLKTTTNIQSQIYGALRFGLNPDDKPDFMLLNKFIEYGFNSSVDSHQFDAIDLALHLHRLYGYINPSWHEPVLRIFSSTNSYGSFYYAAEYIIQLLCNENIEYEAPRHVPDKQKWHQQTKKDLLVKFPDKLPDQYLKVILNSP